MSLLTGPWRRRRDDRIRRATASLRGAALAVATAAASLAEQLATMWDCPDDDADCISEAHARLLAQREHMAQVTDEVERLVHTPLDYEGRVPTDAPRVGGEVPTVIAARRLVDRTHDQLLEATAAARDAMARLDPQQTPGSALG